MPASCNIRPAKSGCVAHDLRHEPQYAHAQSHHSVDASRSHCNKTLFADRDLIDHVRNMTHQPNVLDAEGKVLKKGRKLSPKATRFAAVIYTLPTELREASGAEKNEWAVKAVEHAQSLPGKLAYVVSHLDETTPHIHVKIAPLDERGYLCYSKYYDDRYIPPAEQKRHRQLRQSGRANEIPKKKSRGMIKQYVQRFEEMCLPLGVIPNSPEVKAKLREGYVKDVKDLKRRNERKPARVVPREIIEALAVPPQEPEEISNLGKRNRERPRTLPSPPRWGRKKFFEELQRMWRRMRSDLTAALQEVSRQKAASERAQRFTKIALGERDRAIDQRDRLAQFILDRTPTVQVLELVRRMAKDGISAKPFQRIEREERERKWEKDLGRGR